MIFDIHNDIMTAHGENAEKFILQNMVVLVIWATRLTQWDAFTLARKANTISRTAFEDISFVDDITKLLEVNPLYCSLTWNYDNKFAGGALQDGELTGLGKDAIEFLNSANIPLDTAHLNRKSFFEAVTCADKVLCSHTCFDYVCSHPRNLTDEQIIYIIEKKGIIGITFVSEFLSDSIAKIDDIIRHIDYFVQKFGVKNLAIGTDFLGTAPVDGISNYFDISKISNRLVGLGYSQEAINQIFFKNAQEFFIKN